jgi:hypothetical protein
MDTWGALIFVAVLYLAYQIGRIKGRWEVLTGKVSVKRKPDRENIEKADYEEIK